MQNKEGKQRMLYTIGHSTRGSQELIDVLKRYEVNLLIDIRAIPYSGYNPQFNKEKIAEDLKEGGIEYIHEERLGGVRPTREVMEKARSCSERSVGFGKYMESLQFKEGFERVVSLSKENTIALMCGEKDPTHCHRYLVAAKFQKEEIDVIHILDSNNSFEHPLDLFSI